MQTVAALTSAGKLSCVYWESGCKTFLFLFPGKLIVLWPWKRGRGDSFFVSSRWGAAWMFLSPGKAAWNLWVKEELFHHTPHLQGLPTPTPGPRLRFPGLYQSNQTAAKQTFSLMPHKSGRTLISLYFCISSVALTRAEEHRRLCFVPRSSCGALHTQRKQIFWVGWCCFLPVTFQEKGWASRLWGWQQDKEVEEKK